MNVSNIPHATRRTTTTRRTSHATMTVRQLETMLALSRDHRPDATPHIEAALNRLKAKR